LPTTTLCQSTTTKQSALTFITNTKPFPPQAVSTISSTKSQFN
jgi:hypothetical protein